MNLEVLEFVISVHIALSLLCTSPSIAEALLTLNNIF
jgi:hypothetical protein